MNGQFLITVPETVTAVPSEYAGKSRSDVQLLSINRKNGSYEFKKFFQVVNLLQPGDALVFNNSAMIPSHFRLYDREEGKFCEINIGYSDTGYIAEIRSPYSYKSGKKLYFSNGSHIELKKRRVDYPRFWEILVSKDFDYTKVAYEEGHYIIYGNEMYDLPHSVYKSELTKVPGSVEYPSASRPFTPDIMENIRKKGIITLEITLHCNLGSLDATEFTNMNHLLPEYFSVSKETTDSLNKVHAEGHRVIAVGTTVVRALTTLASNEKFNPGKGYTDIFIDENRVTFLDGLITGMHDPSTSHLLMLSSFTDLEVIKASYISAFDNGFEWHEFGDMCIIL